MDIDTIIKNTKMSDSLNKEHRCNFCNKTFKTSSNLNYHKKTVKYCLDIQNKKDILVEEKKYECSICNKKFNRTHHLDTHFLKCKEKTDLRLNKDENIKLKTLNDEYKKQLYEKNLLSERQKNELDYKDNLIEKYKKELEQQDTKYKKELEKQDAKYKKELEQQEIKYEKKIEELDKRYIERIITLEKEIISIHEKYMDKINVNIQNITNNNPTNNNNSTVVNNRNKLIQNIQPITNKCLQDQNLKMSIDDIKNHAVSLADFYHNSILKDKLLITDKSRNVLLYKDEFGNINRDEGGIKLCNMIINEGKETIIKYALEYLKYLDSQPYTLKNDTQLKLCSLLEKLIFVCQNTNKPNNSKFFQNFKKNFVNRIKEILKNNDIKLNEKTINNQFSSLKKLESPIIQTNTNEEKKENTEDYKFKYLNLEDDDDESDSDRDINNEDENKECYVKEDKLKRIIKEEFIIKKSDILYKLLTKYLDFLDIKAEEKGELEDDYYFVVSSLQSLKKINTDKKSKDKREIDIINSLYNGKEFIDIYFRGLMNIQLYENELINKNYLTKNDIYTLLNDDITENINKPKNKDNSFREEEIDENHYVYKKYKEEYMKTKN